MKKEIPIVVEVEETEDATVLVVVQDGHLIGHRSYLSHETRIAQANHLLSIAKTLLGENQDAKE